MNLVGVCIVFTLIMVIVFCILMDFGNKVTRNKESIDYVMAQKVSVARFNMLEAEVFRMARNDRDAVRASEDPEYAKYLEMKIKYEGEE